MLKLFRLLFYVAAIYGGFLVAFPQWDGVVYHVASLSVLAGAAVAVFILHKLIDISSTLVKIVIELVFVAAVAGWFGYTLPTKSGKTPWEEWSAGHRPSQSEAREGFSRLGVNPNSQPAAFIVGLFPR